MPTDVKNRAQARCFDLTSASAANVLHTAGPQPLAAWSSQSGNCRRHWLDIPEDDNPRPRKLFSRGSARHVKVVSDLQVAMCPSSGAIADAILHEHISPRRPSPTGLDNPRVANSAVAAAARVPRFTAAPSLAPERWTHRLPPLSSVPAVSSHLLLARLGISRRSDGL